MSSDNLEDYSEWRKQHAQTHAIISDLEEKKRLLSEQVKIQKLYHQIDSLETALKNYQNVDKNISGLSDLEKRVLKIIYESDKPLDRLQIWNEIRHGDPMSFVNFARLQGMGFIKRSGFTKWTRP